MPGRRTGADAGPAALPLTRPAPADSLPVMTEIVVLGSVNMDLVGRTSHFPAPGETVLGGEFRTAPGGKGGNQAVAAARAGGTVAMIGAVGTDEFAPRLLASLTGAGVRTDGMRRLEGSSGVALITVDDGGENTIVVLPGANGALTGLTPAETERIAGAGLLMCQLEIPLQTVADGIRAAAAAGTPVLLNPSPARELPTELLAGVTVAVVNEGEAATLGPALDGVPHVVTTLGSRGATHRGPDGAVVAVAAPSVTAIDTTGAGDAFTGALAVAWVQGLTPADAVRRACAAGALATTRLGAAPSAPSAAEIDALVAGAY